jgi:hypothetical protein
MSHETLRDWVRSRTRRPGHGVQRLVTGCRRPSNCGRRKRSCAKQPRIPLGRRIGGRPLAVRLHPPGHLWREAAVHDPGGVPVWVLPLDVRRDHATRPSGGRGPVRSRSPRSTPTDRPVDQPPYAHGTRHRRPAIVHLGQWRCNDRLKPVSTAAPPSPHSPTDTRFLHLRGRRPPGRVRLDRLLQPPPTPLDARPRQSRRLQADRRIGYLQQIAAQPGDHIPGEARTTVSTPVSNTVGRRSPIQAIRPVNAHRPARGPGGPHGRAGRSQDGHARKPGARPPP